MTVERPVLLLEAGMDEPCCWPLEKEVITLGRWPDNDVVLPDRLVSRYHARICRVGSQWVLADCQSTNGTFVNGARLSSDRALQPGDQIQIAPQFQLRFVDHASTEVLPHAGSAPRLTLNEAESQVLIGPAGVNLSRVQYALLRFLFRNERRVVSRTDIVREIWVEENPSGVTNEAIDALIRRVRERLAEVDAEHQYIKTVRGHGFRFENRPWQGERSK